MEGCTIQWITGMHLTAKLIYFTDTHVWQINLWILLPWQYSTSAHTDPGNWVDVFSPSSSSSQSAGLGAESSHTADLRLCLLLSTCQEAGPKQTIWLVRRESPAHGHEEDFALKGPDTILLHFFSPPQQQHSMSTTSYTETKLNLFQVLIVLF